MKRSTSQKNSMVNNRYKSSKFHHTHVVLGKILHDEQVCTQYGLNDEQSKGERSHKHKKRTKSSRGSSNSSKRKHVKSEHVVPQKYTKNPKQPTSLAIFEYFKTQVGFKNVSKIEHLWDRKRKVSF